MKPQFRFTLDENKVIADPIGWDEIELILSRHKDYYSVIEEVQLPLTFIANNSLTDGGYEYIKQKRDAGVDSIVTLDIAVSWDWGDTFDTFWHGILDLTELVELEHFKQFQCTIMRDDRWSKFINRKGVRVNIQDDETHDGQDATAFIATSHTLNLPSQKIRKTFRSEHYTAVDPLYFRIRYQTTSTNKYGSIDLPNIVTDELVNKLYPGNIVDDETPTPLFFIREAGTYNIQIRVVLSNNDAATAGIVPTSGIFVFIRYNLGTPVQFNLVKVGTSGVDERAVFTYSAIVALNVADQIYLWFQNDNVTGDMSILQQTLFGEENYISIVADTTHEDSTVPGFFIHDVARSIIGHTVGEEYFYSEYFGGHATDIAYDEEGCGVYYRLFGGLNLRGEDLTDKPFSWSFDELWEGINPIFNLGLGYEVLAENEVIRIEPKSHFFDDSTDSIQLDYVNNIEISYDPNFLLTSLKIGYQKWSDEVSAGNDDPQTVHNYATRFKTVGSADSKNPKILSSLVAASLVIEEGRRLGLDLEKDWNFDEEKFIVQTTSSLSPEEVKLYSNEVITNLQNAETRYNVRLTPTSNFNRWKDFLFIAFQNYVGDIFRFVDGEGNVKMTFNHPGATGCDAEAGTSATENADLIITEDFIFLPVIYKFTHPLTWDEYKGLRDYKHKSFLITYINNEGTEILARLFIKTVKYRPNESNADFECWLKRIVVYLTLEGLLEGVGTWRISDIGFVGTISLDGPSESGSVSLGTLTGSVTIIVSKQTNGALAQGDGEVRFYKNGVLEPGSGALGTGDWGTQTFVDTQNVGNISYTYSGVIDTDILRAEIQEGP